MDIQQILQSLESVTVPFPREAVRAAIRQREEITPALLESLQNPVAVLKRLLDEEDYMLPYYAMFLLAQFRETRAYPLIVELFSGPADMVDEAFDDFLTEDLCRVLACVCGDDGSLIRRLVESDDVNEWVRGAALDAQIVLVVAGMKSREEILAYYKSLFEGRLTREPHSIWGFLINNCCDLYPDKVLEDIKKAYQDDLVDESMIDMADVERSLATGKVRVLAELHRHSHYRLIDDTVAEMEGWPCFEPPEPPRQRIYVPGRVSKVGRNDPCPCGSGKKYKKCCGKPQ